MPDICLLFLDDGCVDWVDSDGLDFLDHIFDGSEDDGIHVLDEVEGGAGETDADEDGSEDGQHGVDVCHFLVVDVRDYETLRDDCGAFDSGGGHHWD